MDQAGKKSIGLVAVIASTSRGSKRNSFTRATILRSSSGSLSSLETTRAIVTSPEVLIFLFFMITDPKTVPRGRVSHVVFCFLVAACSLLLMAPQSSEFWTKVGLLGGLTVMCVLRPLLLRVLPAADSDDDHFWPWLRRLVSGRDGLATTGRRIGRSALIAAALVAVSGGVVAAGIPARRIGQPAEFGDFCAYLCSAQAGFITGQNLLIDGGAFSGIF